MDREAVDRLLVQVLGTRIGYIPASWPRRLYDLVERMAQTAGMDPSCWLGSLLLREDGPTIDYLLDAATIGHTAFFRHPEQFAELRIVSQFAMRIER